MAKQPNFNKLKEGNAQLNRMREAAPEMYKLLTELEVVMRQFPALEGSRSLVVAVLASVDEGLL